MKLLRIIILIGIFFLLIFPSTVYSTFFDEIIIKKYDLNEEDNIVLVTGFEPFHIYDINPSQLIAEYLNGTEIDEIRIVGFVLPVDFDESVEIVTNLINSYNPVLVISVGLSAIARCIEIEKIGLNLKKIPRNNSNGFFFKRLNPNGPFIMFSSINTWKTVTELRRSDISVRQSFSAGTYVCNAVMYSTLFFVEDKGLSTKVGFIHVPLLDSQDPNGMKLEKMINAVKISIVSNL